jgi:predicted amidohydrolase
MSTLHITTLQADLVWENKSANLRYFEDQILNHVGATEVIVLPEMFSTGFTMRPELFAEPMEGETIGWMSDLSRRKKAIITGSLIVSEGGGYFNRLVWMQPDGQYGHYDKRHLFSLAGEEKHYKAGSKKRIASVKGWKINLQVCYDLRFPVWARQPPQGNGTADIPRYDVLLYVANWPEKRNHAWKTLLVARAIENQCYVVGVNRVGNDGNGIYHSGDSLVVDPQGQILYHAADRPDTHGMLLQKSTLDETRKALSFLDDADSFYIEP